MSDPEVELDIGGLTAQLLKPGPVAALEVDRAGSDLGIAWPADYRDFMIENGGGEGWVGAGYLALWPVSQLVENNLLMELPTNAPGLVGIGTDGGGELFAFDTSGTTPTLVMTPMIGLDRPVPFASFRHFLRRMAADDLFGSRYIRER